MSLQIIGVGWGRTGTLSLKSALEILGFGPCYHMTELLRNPEYIVYWQKAMSGYKVDWGKLFRGYKAAVDYPTCQHWRAIRNYHDDAKFILTVRDADQWYDSVKSTIYSVKPSFSRQFKFLLQLPFSKQKRQLLEVFRYIQTSIWEMDFDGKFADRVYATGKYLDHIELIKQNIDSDKLLVYDISSGWPLLCEFLAVDIPSDIPFPLLNRRDQFSQMIGEFL